MAERWGPRPMDEIEKEPPKEAPVHVPADDTNGPADQSGNDTTPPDTGDDLGGDVGQEAQYTELVQDGYGAAVRDNLTGGLYDPDQREALEREAEYIMAETDGPIGGGATDMADDAADFTPPEVGDDLGSLESDQES